MCDSMLPYILKPQRWGLNETDIVRFLVRLSNGECVRLFLLPFAPGLHFLLVLNPPVLVHQLQ